MSAANLMDTSRKGQILSRNSILVATNQETTSRVEDVRTTPPDYLSLVSWTKTRSLSKAVCQTHYNPVGNPFHEGRVESTKAMSATNGGESQGYFKYSNPTRDSLKTLDCSESRGERTVSKRYSLSSSLSLITQRRRRVEDFPRYQRWG